MYIVISYAVYLMVTLAVTVWTARTLHSSGRIFLIDAFQGNQALADSVNRLLVVGFYLINVGVVALVLSTHIYAMGALQTTELAVGRIGGFLLVPGCLHFIALYILSSMRHNRPQGQHA